MPSNQSLEGITVIDCSQILAGPFCSMLLADHGARVIKVENQMEAMMLEDGDHLS